MLTNEIVEQYGTDRQKLFWAAVQQHGGYAQAGEALQLNESTIRSSLQRLQLHVRTKGYAPEYDINHPVPDPYIMKGYSTYYPATETRPAQWVKSSLSHEAYMEIVKGAIEAFVAEQPTFTIPEAKPLHYGSDIIPWINIGDGHLGMLAHGWEVGADFDMAICEREICAAIDMLVDEMPGGDRIVINDLGDFTHFENFKAWTEASGHQLDAADRFPMLIDAYARIMRRIIEKALTKFETVDFIPNQGNHSRTNDIWIAVLIKHVYGHTGRVNVLDNRSVFVAYRMGNTLVLVHHGDRCKPDRLADIMVSDYAADFGETQFHYIDTGHVHHRSVAKEGNNSITIESFNTLAPGDKHAHDHGWRSRQSITAVFRSRKYGEVGRRVLPIQEVWDRLGVKAPERKKAFVA